MQQQGTWLWRARAGEGICAPEYQSCLVRARSVKPAADIVLQEERAAADLCCRKSVRTDIRPTSALARAAAAGPHGSVMNQIADAAFDPENYRQIMGVLARRLQERVSREHRCCWCCARARAAGA